MGEFIIALLHEIGLIIVGVTWPLVILIIVFTFKKHIISSMPFMFNNIRKLKYGKFEAEFERVYKEAEKLKLPEVKHTDKLAIDITVSIEDEYRKLAEVSPRISIMQAWVIFEKTVFECVEKKSLDSKHLAFDRAITKLLDTCIISNDEFKLIKGIKQLRNLAAHEIDFKISADKAVEYAILLSKMETKIVSACLLDDATRDALFKAVAGDGKIVVVHDGKEYRIRIGGKDIEVPEKDIVFWDNVIEDLEESDFIKELNDQQDTFEVTSKGYGYANQHNVKP